MKNNKVVKEFLRFGFISQLIMITLGYYMAVGHGVESAYMLAGVGILISPLLMIFGFLDVAKNEESNLAYLVIPIEFIIIFLVFSTFFVSV